MENQGKDRDLQGEMKINTPVYRLTVSVYRWFVVSCLWLICSIPIITCGAASCAALHEFLREDGAEGNIVSRYFRTFKTSFLPGTVVFVPGVLLLFLLFLDVSFYRQAMENRGVMFWIFTGVVILLALLALNYMRICFLEIAENGSRTLREILKAAFGHMIRILPACGAISLLNIAFLASLVGAPVLLFLVILFPGMSANLLCILVKWFDGRNRSYAEE